MWLIPIGPFKPISRVFIISSILFVLSIYYLLFIIITKAAQWSSGGGASRKSNGTWVRIPGPPNASYYFFPDNPIQAPTWCTMLPQISRRQMASRPNLKAKIECAPCSLVNVPWRIAKVNQASSANGPQNVDFTSFPGPTPPWLFLISFFSFI